jgi:TolB-like protein/cytochrome c-type biogenesis protein CcmH/NrfG
MACSQRVQFGGFEADLATGELFHNGDRLFLQEKPFQILALLLSSPGQFVTRQEIVAQVWPDVFVENDLSLNTAVRRLRAVLEKADPKTDFIETVGSRGYRLRVQVKFPTAPAGEIAPVRDRLRLAVLPFTNLTEEARDHFCEGLTAQMIVQLGHACKGIYVISPISSFHFGGGRQSLSQIAQRLRADYVLVGTVSRVSPQLRVTGRLIRAADQCCLWSESFTRQDRDIFQVQDEITRSISQGLRQTLPEPRAAQPHMTTTPEVYATYLKARFFSYKFTQSSFEKATKLLEQVIAEDADFAPAYAALAHMLTAAVSFGGPPHQVFYRRIEMLANRALELCQDIAEADSALGFLRLQQADWAACERAFLRAQEINPSYSLAYVGSSLVFSAKGRHQQAISTGKQACDLDPVSPTAHMMLGYALYRAGEQQEALESELKALEIDPGFCPAHGMLGFIYHEMGKLHESVVSLRAAVKYAPDVYVMQCLLAWGLASAGEREEAARMLCELLEVRKTNCLPAVNIALIYTALGQREQAWTWLEMAMLELDPWRMHIAVEPRFKCFWSDPRFPHLLRELGFPSNSPAHLFPTT